EAAQRLVTAEVESHRGEIELDVARSGLGDAARSVARLVYRRHQRRRVHREVPLVDQPLDQLVEQLGELGLPLFVAVAAKRLEHLGGELPALDERIEDRLTERLERAVAVLAEVPAVVGLL